MDNNQNSDFASLLEESFIPQDNFAIGDKIKGRVVAITNENVFVDILGKTEATIDITEFLDENKTLTVKVNDHLEAYLLSRRGGEIVLTTKIGKNETNPELLKIAYQNKIPVEGQVSSLTKGGFQVNISGYKCFCPLSQIALKGSSNPEKYINKIYQFIIIEYGEKGRNIILSRKPILEEANDLLIETLKQKLKIETIVKGKITALKKFGLFVEVDGFQILIPRSEISWSRHTSSDVYQIGDEVSAKIISLDWDKNQVSASLKQLEPEPWGKIVNYQEGQEIEGKIINIIKNGAFIELEPGLEGFIPISKISSGQKIKRIEDILKISDKVKAKILNINQKEKRLSLELINDKSASADEKFYQNFLDEKKEVQESNLGTLFKEKFANLKKDLKD